MASMTDFLQLLAQNAWLYGGSFLIVLSILVFVHEWGHYIVARMCGVKVETFSIGFGPELFGYNDKAGTRWKVSLIPLGGYVKMFGDADPASAGHTETVKDGEAPVRPMTAQERQGAFFAKSVGQRAAIVFAGPAINFIFAILILFGLYVFYGKPETPAIATAVIEGSAADIAGFQPHDTIIAINGHATKRFEDIRRAAMIALDTPITFSVERNGQMMEIEATPEKFLERDRFGFSQSRGVLGVLGPSQGIHLSAVLAVNGQDVSNADEARELLKDSLGKEVRIKMDSGDAEEGPKVIFAVPQADMNKGLFDAEDPDYNHIIITSKPTGDYQVHFGLVGGFVEAVKETASITTGTLQALWQMVTGTRSTKELGGIIRIGALAGDMASAGIIALITFTALLSINLGLINLFPIPLLDGGHLVFFAAEAVKGGPVSENVQEVAFRAGLVFLVGLMIFANLNDLFHLIL